MSVTHPDIPAVLDPGTGWATDVRAVLADITRQGDFVDMPATGQTGERFFASDIGVDFVWDSAASEWVPANALAVNVYAKGATGDGVTDDTAACQAAATAAAGGTLVFPPGVFVIDPTDPILIDDDTLVWIQKGATVLMKPNTATANAIYRLFSQVAAAPNNLAFIVDGIIDGTRRNGNHGAGENTAGLWFGSFNGFSVTGSGKFYNFRSEAIYCDRVVAVPSKIFFDGFRVEDCGSSEAGDTNTNARQGIALISAADAYFGPGLDFDTIAGFAIDCEGNNGSDTFDNIFVSPEIRYRECGQGAVNVTSPGTVTRIRVPGGPIGGTVTPTGFSLPALQKRTKTVRRTSGNLTFNNTTYQPLASAAGLTASLFDLILPAEPNDIIEAAISAWWSDTGAANGCLDVCTIDGAGAIINRFSTANVSGADYGVAAWLGITGVRSSVGGSVFLTIAGTDPIAGYVTLRPYCRNDAAVNRTIAGTGTAGLLAPFQFSARNLGPQG
jgi:hypothetical protein